MNRREFLSAAAACAALPSFSGAAPSEEDARIRREIEAHPPGRLARLPSDFSARVGATHVAGKYHFTDKPFLVEGAERLIELGTRLGKFWFMPQGAARDYPFNSNWTKTNSFIELATTEYWERVFTLPFATLILEAHAPIEGGWRGAKSQPFYDQVSRQFFELTTHLYSRLADRDVTIILQHWEGDWMLRGEAGAK